ncbi:MAG TPA: FAD-binding oxidoreductase [Flavisolibacter sp.]
MQVDYIIVGQGLCGSLLSWYLQKEGKTVLVIDNGARESASLVAAGVINPVTGRRYVTSWMIDELIRFAQRAYAAFGEELETTLIVEKDLIDFFPSPQMRDAFVNRITEDDTYLHTYPDQNHFNQYFHYDFGCGKVAPVFTVFIDTLLAVWRKKLVTAECLKEEAFDAQQLELEDGTVQYKGIGAGKIIFCEGASAMTNPWFGVLPFSAVKGEALVIRCEGLTNEHIYKKGLVLVPLADEHTFWVGSNYLWEFEDAAPSAQFLKQTKNLLERWLKPAFEVIAHKAAVRPATIERRPFVGLHPHHPQLGILNGMGTKGASLAPFFAHQLVQHLVHGFPIMDEANVSRFTRILSHT